MKRFFPAFVLNLGIAAPLCVCGCGGSWTSGDDSAAVSCDLGEWYGGTPSKLAVSSDEESLYILDRNGTVYGYGRNDSRVCAFESNSGFASYGALALGFADDIAPAGSYLYYDDGLEVRRYNDSSWTCGVSPSSMAVNASSIAVAGDYTLADYKLTSSGCTKKATSFVNAERPLAVAADDQYVITAESVTGSGSPERLVIYDRSSGSVEARSALSELDSSELHFCEATRLRLGNGYILLLDAKCGYIGVFDYNGTLSHRLDLSDFGIRSPEDIAVAGDVLYILNGSSVRTLYRLDFATYSWDH